MTLPNPGSIEGDSDPFLPIQITTSSSSASVLAHHSGPPSASSPAGTSRPPSSSPAQHHDGDTLKPSAEDEEEEEGEEEEGEVEEGEEDYYSDHATLCSDYHSPFYTEPDLDLFRLNDNMAEDIDMSSDVEGDGIPSQEMVDQTNDSNHDVLATSHEIFAGSSFWLEPPSSQAYTYSIPPTQHMVNFIPSQVPTFYAPISEGAMTIFPSESFEDMQEFSAMVAAEIPGSATWGIVEPNPYSLGLNPNNHDLAGFLESWAGQPRPTVTTGNRREVPHVHKIRELESKRVRRIRYTDLQGDKCDFQGIDWSDLQVRRSAARERRLETYKNFTQRSGADRLHDDLQGDRVMTSTGNFFRFRCMDIKLNIHLAHFQLRNLVACASRTQAFCAGNKAVHELNPVTGESRVAGKFEDEPGWPTVSTLAAGHGTVIVGGFTGEYWLRRQDSDETSPDEAWTEGFITSSANGMTNHIQIFQGRGSSSARAGIASNDTGFRILDLETEKFLSEETFAFPLNCSALSPDRRLRIMVGDHRNALVTAAESTLGGSRPEVLHELDGHRDFGFACDWADDGWTVATAYQDRAVKIWDARRWTDSSGRATPVCTIRTRMAAARSLHFSPAGSGRRVLVAAEEADYVNVLDARTWDTAQRFDLFGEIGGASFANDGQDLVVLCCDKLRGGVMQLERCGPTGDLRWKSWDDVDQKSGEWHDADEDPDGFDWPRSVFNEDRRIRISLTRRRRAAAAVEELDPF